MCAGVAVSGSLAARLTCLRLRQRFDLVELSIVRRAADPGPLVEQFLRCALGG